MRWYSDAKEAPPAEEAKKEDEEAKTETKTEEGGGELAELKKQLEAKDTEAREWKVRSSSILFSSFPLPSLLPLSH